MAVICPEQRLLFIMAPRTGCTAVAEVLRAELNGSDIPAPGDPAARRAGVPAKHATLGQLLAIGAVSRQQRAGLFVFSAVRNPYDSIVSLYVKQASGYRGLEGYGDDFIERSAQRRQSVRSAQRHSFEEWLVDNYEKSLRRRLSRRLRSLRGGGNKWLEGVDFVMRYERLQEDFDEALARAGVDQRLRIPRVNMTPGRERDYRVYYTDRARQIVEDWYKRELLRFGYTFD